MSEGCVVAVYGSFAAAEAAVGALEKANYSRSQISLITHNSADELHSQREVQFGDESESQATAGAGIGGGVGLLLGAVLLTIPGIGPLLVAGPLAAGLTGAMVGGFLGSLSGWGIHEDHIAGYEAKVRLGNFLVMVNGPPDDLAVAERVLRETDLLEIHVHAQMSDDDPQIDDRPSSSPVSAPKRF